MHSPSVIFGIEKKISANDRDTDCNNGQNKKNQQHKSENVIYLVRPEWSEDEVPSKEE